MNKKELFQGVLVGLLANIIGLVTAAIVLGKLSGNSDSILTVLETAHSENFIRKRQDARAGGVLAATIIIALATFLIKL